MELKISRQTGVKIEEGMIGLFFEDINYAADGGLYAEMIENRSFEFLKAAGEKEDYFVEYDGGYGWSTYPSHDSSIMKLVMGSPLSIENPHYLRLTVREKGAGVSNKAYDGICLKKGNTYHVTFFARCIDFNGDFKAGVEKNGVSYGEAVISSEEGTEETYNRFCKYQLSITAKETVRDAVFLLTLSVPGTVELDFISMFPSDAVAGVFRKDLFDLLKDLKPGFFRFPGGCIVEGNTLSNRYHFKDSLKAPWSRANNWNRWAVHNTVKEDDFVSIYSHYNQTMGLGYYEYFLLCELTGAKPIPVLNVGFACQYQSTEMVPIDSPEFKEFLQDAIDLIEFANGDASTKWGTVRAAMGHEEPFHLTILGVGNEQWQTDQADFFERYEIFEKTIHEYAPEMKLIGSAGPDVTSEKYDMAWEFYHKHKEDKKFVYAVDEHYYVKPQWMYENVDFYDQYSREVKVFSGEYAAHPVNGMNRPDANTLEGALAEAAFLTGVERNADVVVLASYAPLFARLGYAQWSPDMIWFDGSSAYETPSYYVQRMYANHMGDMTIAADSSVKEAAKEGLYYNLSCDTKTGEIIVKIVNADEGYQKLAFYICEEWGKKDTYKAEILSGDHLEDYNSIENPTKVVPYHVSGTVGEGIELPGKSFAVIRI